MLRFFTSAVSLPSTADLVGRADNSYVAQFFSLPFLILEFRKLCYVYFSLLSSDLVLSLPVLLSVVCVCSVYFPFFSVFFLVCSFLFFFLLSILFSFSLLLFCSCCGFSLVSLEAHSPQQRSCWSYRQQLRHSVASFSLFCNLENNALENNIENLV